MTPLGPAPSPRPGLALPSASAEQMSVGRGLGVWVEATNKHHCDPEPPAQQKQGGASKDPRSIRKWRLDLPGVGGRRWEVGSLEGAGWGGSWRVPFGSRMGWERGLQAWETMNFGAEGPKVSLPWNAGD